MTACPYVAEEPVGSGVNCVGKKQPVGRVGRKQLSKEVYFAVTRPVIAFAGACGAGHSPMSPLPGAFAGSSPQEAAIKPGGQEEELPAAP